MCTILRYCGIIAMLQYQEKGPECPTCKNVAKNKKNAFESVLTELQSLFLSKCLILQMWRRAIMAKRPVTIPTVYKCLFLHTCFNEAQINMALRHY